MDAADARTGPRRQGRPRRPRPRRQGRRPHPARRRLRGDLHRAVPDPRHGRRGGRRRGRRRHRPVDAVGRPHDAGAARRRKVRARGADIPVVVGGIVPDADVRQAARGRRGRRAHARRHGRRRWSPSSAAAIAVARLTVGRAIDRVERLTNLLALLLETDAAADARRDRRRAARASTPARRRPGGRRSSGTRRRCARSACRSRPTVLSGEQAGQSGVLDRPRPLRADRPRTSSPTRCGRCRWPSPRCARRRAARRCGSSALDTIDGDAPATSP